MTLFQTSSSPFWLLALLSIFLLTTREFTSASSSHSLLKFNGGSSLPKKHSEEDFALEPDFIDQIPNITVAAGRDAKIPCQVKNLGHYKVAWLRVESKTILTIHHHIITRNYRIGLSHSEDRLWNLHLNDVQESDRGEYMCQINTVPMRSQVGYLDVVVPPDIIASESSSDVMVRENTNATLLCKAKGRPQPSVTWRREDGKAIEFGNWNEKRLQQNIETDVYEGEALTINKVSRLHMGAYLCIANNKIPPSVSRRVVLKVHFPPMIHTPNQLIGAALGGDAILICNTEAFPISINYWTKDDDEALIPSPKYDINNTEKGYKTQMALRIRNIVASDFGSYACIARNSLGTTQGSIKLYEVHSHLPGGSKTTGTTSSKIESQHRGNSANVGGRGQSYRSDVVSTGEYRETASSTSIRSSCWPSALLLSVVVLACTNV